jgi:hypothetical protein
MTLKYYALEKQRYGTLGVIDASVIQKAADMAAEHFKIPRVKVTISRKPQKSSWYKSGLNMVALNNGRWPPMAVPHIKMACNMMVWRTFCHEFAHHLHAVRYDAAVRQKYSAYTTLNFDSTLEADRKAIAKHIRWHPGQQGHGPQHALAMQDVVDFFIGNGMITEMPPYMTNMVSLAA